MLPRLCSSILLSRNKEVSRVTETRWNIDLLTTIGEYDIKIRILIDMTRITWVASTKQTFKRRWLYIENLLVLSRNFWSKSMEVCIGISKSFNVMGYRVNKMEKSRMDLSSSAWQWCVQRVATYCGNNLCQTIKPYFFTAPIIKYSILCIICVYIVPI